MSNGDLLHNASGYKDPTAYEAIRNVSRERKRGNKKMTAANRICIEDIKSYEIIIAKCGALCLKWIVSPRRSGGRFELYTGDSISPVCVTSSLNEAIEEYNMRVN